MHKLNILNSILCTWFCISYMFLQAANLEIERINLISNISLNSETVIYPETTTKVKNYIIENYKLLSRICTPLNFLKTL